MKLVPDKHNTSFGIKASLKMVSTLYALNIDTTEYDHVHKVFRRIFYIKVDQIYLIPCRRFCLVISIFLPNSKNSAHLKYFGNVYCVMTNHIGDQDMHAHV